MEKPMIRKVEIHNLGTLDNFSYDNFGHMNLIIGENGTGKTFLLKSLYTAMKTIEEFRRGDDIRSDAEILSHKLRWTFQAEKLGDIVRKKADSPYTYKMKMFNNKTFSYEFTARTTTKLSSVTNEMPNLVSNSIYIPAKEVLSLFNVIRRSREVDQYFGFDDTYYDLVKALQISPTRGRNYTVFANSRKMLKDIIDGQVEYDNSSNQWYYKKGSQKYNIHITSEGVKKIAILDRLLLNGYLSDNSVIFIDEIESALHPKAISELLDIIDIIAFEMGVQVFIASHSYFVIKKLYLLALKRKRSIPCISLTHNGSANYYDLLDGMPANSIIDESVRLYEEEINEVL